MKCRGVERLLLIFVGGDLSISRMCMPVSFPKLGKFSAKICSNTLSGPLFLSAASGTPFQRRFFLLRLSFISLNLSSWSFYFSFFLSILPCHQHVFYVTHHSSTSLTSSLGPPVWIASHLIDFNFGLIRSKFCSHESLESFILFSRAISSFIIVLLYWHSDIELSPKFCNSVGERTVSDCFFCGDFFLLVILLSAEWLKTSRTGKRKEIKKKGGKQKTKTNKSTKNKKIFKA